MPATVVNPLVASLEKSIESAQRNPRRFFGVRPVPTELRPAGESAKALPRKARFTQALLDGIRPPASGRTTIYDAKTPALAYVVTSNNARGFYFVGRVAGRANRLRLGGDPMTVEQARDAAMRIHGQKANGVDVAAERRNRRQADTLGELWTAYLEKHLKARCTSKTQISDTSRWETCLEDWQSRKVLDITPADVRSLHADLGRTRGHTTANRAIQLLRRLYSYGRFGYSPVGRGDVTLFRETSRTRFLSPAELKRFLEALAHISVNQTIADVIRLSLFTGCRRSNAQAARASEFDLDNPAGATWTIPAGKSKNAEPMILPLVPAAVEIVRRRMNHPSGFLFPSHSIAGHVVEVKSTWQQVMKLAKLTDVHFHDCRRTYASWQAAGGASLSVIGKSLGHRHLSATEIYSRLDLSAVRESANKAVGAMLAMK